MMMLHYPTVKQRTRHDCGASCVSSVLRRHNIKHQYIDLCRRLKLGKNGAEEAEIVRYLKNEAGIDAEYCTDMRVSDVLSCLKNRWPVLAIIQAWSRKKNDDYSASDSGHYVLACGHNGNSVVFMDPTLIFGYYGTLDYEEFDRRWYLPAEDGSRRRSGIVIRPPEENRLLHID